jgi:putative PIN family toxin of toxin-antitoxin system
MCAVVLDTNVFIDAIFRRNIHAQQLLKWIVEGRVIALMSDACELELMLTVTGVFIQSGLTFPQARNALTKVLTVSQRCTRVAVTTTFSGCEDADDNKFFECAVSGCADYLVSCDCHVSGANAPPVPVLSPWQFLKLHERRQGRMR